MAKAKELTAKQALFVKEYLIDLNATQAAIRAGYARSTAEGKAQAWVGKRRDKSTLPHVWDAVQKQMDKRSKKTEITAEYVLETIKETITRCLDEDNYMPQHALKGLELLGKHLVLFTDKVDHTGTIKHEEVGESELARRLAFVLARGATSKDINAADQEKPKVH